MGNPSITRRSFIASAVLIGASIALDGCAGKSNSVSALPAQDFDASNLTSFQQKFENGPARAQHLDELWGFIDETGEWVIEPIFMKVGSFDKTGIAAASDETGMWGFIDTSGQWVIEPIYYGVTDFYEDLAGAVVDSDSGAFRYIDRAGDTVIPEGTLSNKRIGCFDGGLAPAVDPSNGFWGYINKSGEFEIPGQWGFASMFDDGVAFVSFNGNTYSINDISGYLINSKGEALTDFDFDGFEPQNHYRDSSTGNERSTSSKSRATTWGCSGVDGLSWSEGFCKGYLAGIKDAEGNYVLGNAYINRNGEVAIGGTGEFGLLGSFSGGYAAYQNMSTGCWGIIDSDGEIVMDLYELGGEGMEICAVDAQSRQCYAQYYTGPYEAVEYDAILDFDGNLLSENDSEETGLFVTMAARDLMAAQKFDSPSLEGSECCCYVNQNFEVMFEGDWWAVEDFSKDLSYAKVWSPTSNDEYLQVYAESHGLGKDFDFASLGSRGLSLVGVIDSSGSYLIEPKFLNIF